MKLGMILNPKGMVQQASAFLSHLSSFWYDPNHHTQAESEPTFFIKAHQSEDFQRYHLWFKNFEQQLKQLYKKLKQPHSVEILKNINEIFSTQPADFSPLYYDVVLKKFAHDFPRYANVFNHFSQQLENYFKENPDAALDHFYQDIKNHLVLMAGNKISKEAFIEQLTLSLYAKVIPADLYQSVLILIENFNPTYRESETVYPYKWIANEGIENLMMQIEETFVQFEAAENVQTLEEKPDSVFYHLQQHSHITIGTILITSSLYYLFMQSGSKNSDLSNKSFFNMQWPISSVSFLTSITLSYGLHQYNSPLINPLLEGAIVLPALFSLSAAQTLDFGAQFNLSNLNGRNGFVVNGIHNDDHSGYSIGSGDINGDNVTDLLIGAISAAGNRGQSYVVFGSTNLFPASFNLTSLDGKNGFVITGISSDDHVGISIDSGDINGDSIADLFIGADGAPSGANKGQSYVVFGSRNPFFASFDLNELDGTNGFIINGINNGDRSGWSINKGDINGDGITDLFIGAPYALSNQGQSYVVFGSRNLFPASFNLTNLNGNNGFVINGINNDQAGYSISGGDINGDEITDLLIGAPYALNNRGQSYVVFGSRNPFPANFNISSLDGQNGFVINGIAENDFSGFSISSGDINGDSVDDLFIGAYGAPSSTYKGPPSGTYKGQSYVVFGSRNPFSAIFSLTNLNGTNGFVINGININDELGRATNAGDINDDGIADLLIGAYGAPSGTNKGQSYVIFGSRNPFPAIFNLTNLNGTNGFAINGIEENDFSGFSISSGDINGDNVTDLLIGAQDAPGGLKKGQSYVVFGKRSQPLTTGLVTTDFGSTTNAIDSESSSTHKHNNGGIIGGGIAAGVGVIGIIVVAAILIRRARNKNRGYDKLTDDPQNKNPAPKPDGEQNIELAFSSAFPPKRRTLDALDSSSSSFQINYQELKFGEKLGWGGFGVVYQGTWRQYQKVAIKKLLLNNPTKGASTEFEKEMEVMSKLRSPHVVQFYGICLTPKCIVMEYMAKGSLYDVLHSDEALEWSLRAKIALGIACGLAFLHQSHIIHRDLKSLNVLLDNSYQVKLCDFGLAKIKTETATTSTVSTSAKGSVAWMAPELFDLGECTYQSDLYSYGMVVWEIASRQLPYVKANGNSNIIINYVERGKRETIPLDTPPEIKQVIETCWKQLPEQRPTADKVIEDLQKLSMFTQPAPSSAPTSTALSGPVYLSNLN